MKKGLLACLLGLLMFTTAFVVYDHVALANDTTEEVRGDDEYGGPFRRFFQRRKQQRDMRRQRPPQRPQKAEQEVNGHQIEEIDQ